MKDAKLYIDMHIQEKGNTLF